MSKGGQALTIYKYFISQHHVLCLGPIDSIKKVIVDKKEVFSGTQGAGSLVIDKEDLFGGLDREGGVSGTLTFMLGTAVQTANAFMEAKFGLSPAYRHLVSCIHQDVYVGLNYYLKPFSYLVKRVLATSNGSAQWLSAYAEPIAGQMNAIHIVRDLLVDNIYGYGIDPGLIGTSFDTAAQTTFNEGYGFSFLFSNTASLDSYIQTVKDHIDAEIYINRATGKYEIKLIRDDYVVANIFKINSSNIQKLESLKRTLLGELYSKVTIKFWNEATLKDAVESIEDYTLATKQNGTIEKTLNFSGITSHSLAKKIAIRELSQLSTQVYSGRLTCNRTAENLNIGDPFLLEASANKYLETDIVCRVSSIDLGTITDNAIKITYVQDVFSAQENPIFITPSTDWQEVFSSAVNITSKLIQEASYYHFARLNGDAEAKEVDVTASFIGLAAKAPSEDSISATIWINSVKKGVLHFCPYAQVATAIDKLSTTLIVKNGFRLSQIVTGQMLQVGNEIVSVSAIAGNTFTIVRGTVDTVPESHAVDEECFAYQQFYGTSTTQYLLSEVLPIRLTPKTPLNELAFASATNTNLTIIGRMHRPYPPGNLLISGSSWPNVVTPVADAFTITWTTRNRFQQTVGLINYYSGNVTTEPGVTYSGNLKRVDTQAVLSSFSGNATTTQSVATAAYTGQVILTVWAVNANGVSIQSVTHTFLLGGTWADLPATWATWTTWG